jgi:hypothetical protein
MNEERMTDLVSEALNDSDLFADMSETPIVSMRTFADAGLLTNNHGLVVRLQDGSEFQIQIVKSK